MGLLDLSPYKVTNNVSDLDATVLDSGYDAIQAVVNALTDANVDAAAAIKILKLAAGTNGQIIQTVAGVPTWVPGTKTTTSTLAGGPPGSPSDGDIWIATSVDSSGTRWSFQYNAGSASTYKWEFIGGSAMELASTTADLLATASYQRDTRAVLTAARAGEYLVRYVASFNMPASSSMTLDLGFQSGHPSTTIMSTSNPAGSSISHSLSLEKVVSLAASDAASAWLFCSGAGGQLNDRVIHLTPRRVA